MEIGKKGKFLDFDQMASLLYDGGNYTAKEHDKTEVVGYINNSIANAKYYWNNREIYILFSGYVNKREMEKRLKGFCKELQRNNLVVKLEMNTILTATIKWYEKD